MDVVGHSSKWCSLEPGAGCGAWLELALIDRIRGATGGEQCETSASNGDQA
jgi:hypothetical protein